MAKRPTVTATEWELLEVLWGRSPLSTREVLDRLPARGRSVQATRMLLDRLVEKETVEKKDAHGVWVYAPLRQRDEVVQEEGKSFLERCFGGRAELGAAYFIENEELPPEEMWRLKRLLEDRLKGFLKDRIRETGRDD